ncbi:MAG TPA: GTP 3',8-cyclase MoaA [Vicinamibacterales bacterium]|nr:GTP 3',8-cyclase MoaA [Vicinamibacterales bacterium]
MAILDRFGRPLRSLRVSVTDRCNLRCLYCMPEPDYAWLPKETILSFEEIGAIVDAFTSLGVDRVRITGGEPLLRRDLTSLIAALAARPAVKDLALTTNGVLLAPQAGLLRSAGLHRITVSLDTLDRRRFRDMTRFDNHGAVLEGIAAAAAAGFASLKIDTVIIRGVNDDELPALLEYGRDVGAEVRFIEYMDVGGATRWSPAAVFSRRDMLDLLEARYGGIVPIDESSSAPADRFMLPDGTIFGIISSTTAPFCDTCDRSRLTADGVWLMCLYATAGTDLRRPLRAGATDDELRRLIATVWSSRADRGAEERLSFDRREPLIPLSALKKDAHLEMHTRGG